MSANCCVVIAVAICIAVTLGGCGGDGGDKPKPSDDGGAIFFASLNSHDLVRLDHCGDNGCDSPVVIATNLSAYGGLVPWDGSLLAALASGRVVQVNAWCKDSSCPVSTVVDVASALGPGDHGSFYIAGMTWCNSSLFIAFGGQSAVTGVLRCANCKLGADCTNSCSLVNGGAEPGNGTHQLSAFVADIACLDDTVLVADNSNFRVQAIPTSCMSAPCNVQTFTTGLKYPLGLAVVDSGKWVLVTLDEGIVSLRPQGMVQSDSWSNLGDCGYLVEASGRIWAASGGNGNIVSFDLACGGPNCTFTTVWNCSGTTARAGSAIAYLPYQQTYLAVI